MHSYPTPFLLHDHHGVLVHQRVRAERAERDVCLAIKPWHGEEREQRAEKCKGCALIKVAIELILALEEMYAGM